MGERGRECEAEVERVSLYRKGDAGTTGPSAPCISPLGTRKRLRGGAKERQNKKGYEKNMKERNRH